MMLFDTRPNIFTPMRSGRMTWSYVKVEKLDRAELRDLLTAAWRMVAPKKLQLEYLGPQSKQPPQKRPSSRS